MNKKETLSYCIYMWNKFSEKECATIFNDEGQEFQYSLGEHIWKVWKRCVDTVGSDGAPALMVASLDEDTLYRIIDRACELYIGRKHR